MVIVRASMTSFEVMEPKFNQENHQSREKEAELVRSVKKFKDSNGAKSFSQPRN